MKLLADLGVSMTTVRDLRTAGHEVLHLREQPLHRLEPPPAAWINPPPDALIADPIAIAEMDVMPALAAH